MNRGSVVVAVVVASVSGMVVKLANRAELVAVSAAVDLEVGAAKAKAASVARVAD